MCCTIPLYRTDVIIRTRLSDVIKFLHDDKNLELSQGNRIRDRMIVFGKVF